MNTTSRRLIAGIALVLTTALTATACIGYDAKEAPVASGGTTETLLQLDADALVREALARHAAR